MTLNVAPPAPSNGVNLENFWMPFTANRQFKASPRILVSAEGMYYRSDDGRSVIDGTSGLWCVNAGHARREIARAVERQLHTLDFAPTFQMGHPIAFEFAERLAEIAPTGLDRIFFTGSGSESVETALKISLAYQRAIGQGTRTRFVGRDRGYHGVGFGGISVGGIGSTIGAPSHSFRASTISAIPTTSDTTRLPKVRPTTERNWRMSLSRLVALHGAETIAAVIVEPVAGSTGVLIPPQGYLQRLRSICDTHGILLIFGDEVITGFGQDSALPLAQTTSA